MKETDTVQVNTPAHLLLSSKFRHDIAEFHFVVIRSQIKHAR